MYFARRGNVLFHFSCFRCHFSIVFCNFLGTRIMSWFPCFGCISQRFLLLAKYLSCAHVFSSAFFIFVSHHPSNPSPQAGSSARALSPPPPPPHHELQRQQRNWPALILDHHSDANGHRNDDGPRDHSNGNGGRDEEHAVSEADDSHSRPQQQQQQHQPLRRFRVTTHGTEARFT